MAEDRDRTSEGRDRSAEERDRFDGGSSAGTLNAESDRRGVALGRRSTDIQSVARQAGAASDRVRAASDRADSASDREASLANRRAGAADRTNASHDRDAASIDRSASARDRRASSIDDLTGAYRRGSGLIELEREMARAERTRQPFVLAFVDVDGLKVTNDSLGHNAGDGLLRHVVQSLRTHLRSYDLIVRFGGDEFVCAMPDVRIDEAMARFARIDQDLLTSDHASITVGLTEMEHGESLANLIARADEALYEERVKASAKLSP
jgi:diguanylate cyclase (GGDEF)-like protein